MSFEVIDTKTANQSLYIINKLKDENIKHKADKKAIIEDTRLFYDKKINNNLEQIEYQEHLLEHYYNKELEKDKDFKLSTPQGTFFKQKRQSYKYDDEKLLAALEDLHLNDYIRTTKAVDKNKLKDLEVVGNKVVNEQGEILDGVEVEEVESIVIRDNRGV